MSRGELTEKERIKTALMRHRERMRKDRYNREFVTIYSDNLCPVCHHRHVVGAVCRKWRGSVCEKHCMECEHYQPTFQHCLFRESEPIDMRKWRGVCTNTDKKELAIFLHENLLYGKLLREAKEGASGEDVGEILGRMEEIVAARTSPKYAIADSPDEYGNYSIADTDTGEILPLFAVYFEEFKNWTVVEYLPPGA